jgi:hypothetical protein
MEATLQGDYNIGPVEIGSEKAKVLPWPRRAMVKPMPLPPLVRAHGLSTRKKRVKRWGI